MKDIRLEISARVYRILLDFKNNSGIRTFGIKSRHSGNKHILTIYTDRPGLVIGYHGSHIENLIKEIRKDPFDKNVDIELEEINFFIRDDNEPYSDQEHAKFMNDYMMARGF